MSELKELFDMVTKQTEPDLDSWKEQEDRQRKQARNRKAGGFAVAAAIVAIIAIALLASQGGDDGRGPATDAGPSDPGVNVVTHWYLDIATGERTPVAANLGAADISEVSPDGENVLAATCCSTDDSIYVSPLDGSSDQVNLTPGGLNGYASTWIDDRTALFQGRESDSLQIGDLYTVDVVTGELTMVVDLPDLKNGAWVVRSDISPDGTTVLYHLPRGRGDTEYDLWTVPLTGGEPTLLREDAGYAQYTADGSVVYLDHPYPFQGDELWVMDGDGGDARMLVRGESLGWPNVSPDGTAVMYEVDGEITIVDIATGDQTQLDQLSDGPAWYGNDKLII